MFYVKTQLNQDAQIEIDSTRANVFCRCPLCGKEVQADLTDFIGDEDFDLCASEVACDACSRKYLAVAAK